MNNRFDMHSRGAGHEPYIGMPVCLDGCMNINCGNCSDNTVTPETPGNSTGTVSQMCTCIDILPLAMAYVPMQRWGEVYGIEEGFYAGTIFPALNLPFTGGMRR